MKKLLLNSLFFIILMAGIIAYVDYLSMQDETRDLFAKWTNSENYITENVGPGEIRPYLEKAACQDGTTKLIIGDSVCRQMFNRLQETNPEFTIIGSNAAITMSGQYILAKEYLDNHPNATDVFLIVLPGALETTYDTSWGYQYAVMPFVETDTIGYLEPKTIEDMTSVYGDFFMKKEVVEAIDKSAINRKLYLNYLSKYGHSLAMEDRFDIASLYVYKICDLCMERGVSFHLYPCPVSENRREYIEGMYDSFQNSVLYEINPVFLDMIYYYPAEQSNDNIHFTGDYANQSNYNEKIVLMFSDHELLEMLNLGL